jgi:hypothetical protein
VLTALLVLGKVLSSSSQHLSRLIRCDEKSAISRRFALVARGVRDAMIKKDDARFANTLDVEEIQSLSLAGAYDDHQFENLHICHWLLCPFDNRGFI